MVLLKRTKRLVWIILGISFCLNLITWVVIYDLSRSQRLEVIFFDIGQGDAIFIKTPQKHQILIDGGPTSAILEKLAREMPFYDRTLDLLILTHPEHDHLFGLLEVLKRYKVENILWTGVVRQTSEWKEWEHLIKKENAQIKIAKAGQRIILQGSDACIFIDVFYPFENLEGKEFKNINDTSVVASLVFGDISFLFTGDITKSVEGKLVDQNVDLDSEVLKVAHHGSKTSSSLEFLEIVSPELAVIQVGKNNYGHPHPEVLANLKKFDIEVLRTDKNGDIKIVSDGNNLKIKNQRSKIKMKE